MIMTDDKFILMGIDDDNSKDIAEILKSKTAKKILNYLSEVKEVSEKDIADALDIPLNTAEYNLNKLVKGGFVEKSKNFFWSVKGKKIPLYKLAKKHIIIGTKKPSLSSLKSILPIIITIIALIAIITIIKYSTIDKFEEKKYDNELKKFSNLEELKEFLNQTDYSSNYYYGGRELVQITPSAASFDSSAKTSDDGGRDFSKTNLQVEGVDEPDFIKNDDKYIYVVGNNNLYIVNAYPAENMEILSTLNFSKGESIHDLFINEDKLIVLSNKYNYGGCEGEVCILDNTALAGKSIIAPDYYSYNIAIVYIYDISDRTNPILENEIKTEGNYIDSRMIDNYVYVISNKNTNIKNPNPPIFYINEEKIATAVSDVYYFDYPDYNYMFTSIYSINLYNGEFDHKTYLIGASNIIYVSQNNIFLTHQKLIDRENYLDKYVNEVILPLLPDEGDSKVNEIINSDSASYEKMNKISVLVYEYSNNLVGDEKNEFDEKLLELSNSFETKISKEYEKTVIHKIGIKNGDIEYKANGEASGRILNQFSMDEYNGYFRIATTTGDLSGETSLNHMYVLNENLDIVGKVEDLAKGERIYSARFIEDRAYMVTFKKIDPFFVIDLSEPNNPRVLGILKIPGYSDYLHPYDKNHVIGIGKEAIDASEDESGERNLDFAWYQGIKISLFDVSDVENPKEVSKFNIGDRGTDSEALYEHKAFLFDYKKEILVIPISLHEIDENKYPENKYPNGVPATAYGELVYEGVYVLNVNLKDGFSLKGRVTHLSDEELNKILGKERYYYPYYGTKIRRSLYIDNFLYTISMNKIKANDLTNLNDINKVILNNGSNDIIYFRE